MADSSYPDIEPLGRDFAFAIAHDQNLVETLVLCSAVGNALRIALVRNAVNA